MEQNKKRSVCHCINLRRAANRVTEYYDKIMASSGLTVNQYSLLLHLKALQVTSITDLAIEMRLDRSTLVRNLKPLMEAGFVEDIAREGTRNRQLRLTAGGEVVLNRADPLWEQAQKGIEEELTDGNLERLMDFLYRLEDLETNER